MQRLVDTTTTPQPGRFSIDAAGSALRFRTRHMFGLARVRGTFAIRTGAVTVAEPLADSSVYAEIDTASFDTGNDQRDRTVRSRRLLDADRYPVMTFRSSNISREAISGTLTVRDVARPVQLTIEEAKLSPGIITVRATTRVDRTDFGVTAYRGLAGRYLDITIEIRSALDGTSDRPSHV